MTQAFSCDMRTARSVVECASPLALSDGTANDVKYANGFMTGFNAKAQRRKDARAQRISGSSASPSRNPAWLWNKSWPRRTRLSGKRKNFSAPSKPPWRKWNCRRLDRRRSVAVPGHSNARTATRFSQTDASRLCHVAAPGDGRTPEVGETLPPPKSFWDGRPGQGPFDNQLQLWFSCSASTRLAIGAERITADYRQIIIENK